MLKQHLKRINHWFFEKDYSNATFLIFFRMSIGALALLMLLGVIRDFKVLYGKYGIIPWDIQEFQLPAYIITFPKITTIFEDLGLDENTIILLFLLIYSLCCICLIAGLFTRFSAFILLILYISISSGVFQYGVDSFMTTSIFYLMIFPAGHHYSLDNYLFPKGKPINLTPFRRLFQIHIMIVYFFAGIGKAVGYNWWNGEAIWKSIHLYNPAGTFQFNLDWLAFHPVLIAILGIGVVVIETLYPVFINLSKTRKAWLLFVISMHVGIALILNLYYFAVIMIIWNFSTYYFLPEKQAHISSKSSMTIKKESKLPKII